MWVIICAWNTGATKKGSISAALGRSIERADSLLTVLFRGRVVILHSSATPAHLPP